MTKALRKENLRVTMELNDLDDHVLSTLERDYNRSKEFLPIHRYELLKTMIKSAIQRTKPENLQKARRPFGGTTKALRVREETERELRIMTMDEIEANTARKQGQIGIIQDLERDYAASKGVFPGRRYFLMKRMVKRRTLQRPL